MKKLYTILLVLILCGCSPVFGPQISSKQEGNSHTKSLLDTKEVISLSEQEEEILAFIMQEYFKTQLLRFQHFKETDRNYAVYLQVFEKNPSQQLLDRIGDQIFNVLPAHKGITSNSFVTIPDTDCFAELFVFETIDISDDEVAVSAHYYIGPFNAAGYDISLVYKSDGLKLDDWVIVWES